LLQRFSDATGQRRPRLGRRNPRPGAMEQLCAELRFQVADAQADGGGCDAEFGRRSREVSVAHAGLDDP
jgi:hypothetical protein